MLDEELKKLLKENIELSRESLKILRKMNRARIIGSIFHTLKWVVIIGISFGTYIYIQPYVEKYIKTTESVKSSVGKIGEMGDSVNKFLPR